MSEQIANAITPQGVCEGKDAAGGTVGSLTEAVMGITAGLYAISGSLDMVANALEDLRPPKPSDQSES